MPTIDPRRGKALAAYRAGATGTEIAAQLAVCPSTVRRWIAQEQTLRRTGPRGRTDVPDALIIELRDVDQLPYAAIAAVTRMSKTGVINRYQAFTEGRRRDR
ncbi:MAG: helix-turn-helix domain-containing protein [Acidimicrobiales bacterium]